MQGKGTRRASRIADVAALAGVSTATVSRALTAPDKLSPATLARVEAAVQHSGYIPNLAASSLRRRRTMLVLVVVPNIANPFFADVLRGIDDALSGDGYGLLIGNLGHAPDAPPGAKEPRILRLVRAGQVDGVILLNGAILSDGQRTLADSDLPLVAVCEAIPGAAFPQVEVDNRAGARAAVAHLAALGHRRIAYLGGPAGNVLERERRAGFLEGLAEAGIAASDMAHFSGDFTFRSGAAAGEMLCSAPARKIPRDAPAGGALRDAPAGAMLQDAPASAMLRDAPAGAMPTALFAANDEMAIGFLTAVRRAGLRVPDDISVIGFDGIGFADYVDPLLSTLRQPCRALGRQGADLLVRAMTGRPIASGEMHVRLPVELLARASTGPARRD